jgi:hypothetical protein
MAPEKALDIRTNFGFTKISMLIPKIELVQHYINEQKSMADIAKILNCSIHKVEYWLIKHQIARRNRSDANYAKYNPNGDPFSIKPNLSREEQNLYFLAVGLYWGEGGKTNLQSARLTNSDPSVIRIFYTFLTDICQIKPLKIHFHLQTFKDNDIMLAKNYWAERLKISPDLVNTSKPISSQGRGSYIKINPYGVMTIGVYNTHFRAWMIQQLQKLGYIETTHSSTS